MRTITYGALAGVFGNRLPDLWSAGLPRSRFGDAAILLFLIAQLLDGAFTYVGVVTYGISSEGNPILASLMESVGHGPALVGAKAVAAALGIGLHLAGVHTVVACLTGFYMAAAVIPWSVILFGG